MNFISKILLFENLVLDIFPTKLITKDIYKPTVFTYICSLYELLKCTMCTKDVDSSINVKTIKRKPRRLYHWKAAEETLYINKSNSVARINNRANNRINVESFNFNNIPFIFNDQNNFSRHQKHTNERYIYYYPKFKSKSLLK